MRVSCRCQLPIESGNPRSAGSCVACGRILDPAWTSNDKTVASFYTGLQRGVFPNELVIADEFTLFRVEAESREFAGRKRFGHSHLRRDNLREAREEAADGANYLLFDHLQEIRATGRDEDMDLVLTGAKHFYLAHKAAQNLRERRRGAP